MVASSLSCCSVQHVTNCHLESPPVSTYGGDSHSFASLCNTLLAIVTFQRQLNNASLLLNTPEAHYQVKSLCVNSTTQHRAGQRAGSTACLLLSASEKLWPNTMSGDIHPLLFGEVHKVLCVLSPASFSMKAGLVGASAGLLSLRGLQSVGRLMLCHTACEPSPLS